MSKTITFSIQHQNENVILLEFPLEIRNKVWGIHFGEIIEFIEKLKTSHKLKVDLSSCVWVDPLPLLSLLLCLEINKSKFEEITLFLPQQSGSDIPQNLKNKNRVIAFLFSEGFINEFFKLGSAIILNNKTVTYDDLKVFFKKHNSLLFYQDSCIYPATIFTVPKVLEGNKFNKQHVVEILSKCQYKIRSKIDHKSFDLVFNNLKLLLDECLTNIYEHAYPNTLVTSFGIYIRYRIGLTNPTISSAYRKALTHLNTQEALHSPRLSSSFAESVDNFIEVFIIDMGMGFAKSYHSEDSFISKSSYPFRNSWESSVVHGNRNIKNRKNTKYGGLYVLTRILKKGYIVARDETEWVGESLPIKSVSHGAEIIESKKHIPGFALICRFTWDQAIGVNSKWLQLENLKIETDTKAAFFLSAISSTQDIYSKFLKNGYRNIGYNPFYVKDDRLTGFEVSFPLNYLKSPYSENFVLYLPKEELNKFEIHRAINKEFLGISNPSKTLIIADIIDNAASLYLFALNEARYDDSFLQEYEKIILATRNLSILILTRQRNNDGHYTYLINETLTKKYFIEINENTFSPDKSLNHLLQWLKTHDSMIFWRNIFSNANSKSYFIAGEIKWPSNNDVKILESYFNFSQTLSDEISLILYNITLNRAICLKNEIGYDFVSTDTLTSKIAHDINLKKYENHNIKGAKILIGSVYVTGFTQKSLERKEQFISPYSLHFFYNQSLQNGVLEKVPHLFLWPDKNFIVHNISIEKKFHERVGHSFIVAPHGWKYFTIPRYSLKDNPNITIASLTWSEIASSEFISITECPPTETYETWQDGELVSFGHYEYKDQHDFIKVKIPYAFDDSWALLGDLALFIIAEFISVLGVEISQLKVDENFKKRLHKYFIIKKDKIDKTIQNSLIVYPYHYSSEHIVKTIKTILPQESKDLIIPLIQINKNTPQSNFLVSPQSIDIINVSASKGRLAAVIFDTSVVSKKTIKDIKHLLKSSKIFNFRTLTLLDRRMLPLHNFDWQKDKSYWRLDTPKLGHKNNCLLCKALRKISNLKSVLISEILKLRIDEIVTNWSTTYRYDGDASNHGIKPIEFDFDSKIEQSDFIKNFSIYIDEYGASQQIGGEKNRIKITNSYGATIYCLEIHAMTTRDTICLKICNSNIPVEAKLQILSCNLLLFNHEFSFDTKQGIIKLIFILLENFPTTNNYTAIAALSLIAEPDIIEIDLKEWVFGVLSNKLNIKNKDLVIFLCEFSQRPNSKLFKNHPEIKRLLIGFENLRELQKLFHRELYNDYGASHATPLHYVFNEEGAFTRKIFSDAYDSVLKMLELVNGFFPTEFNDDELKNHILQLKGTLKEQIQKVEKIYLQTTKLSEENFAFKSNSIRKEAIVPLTNMEKILKDIHLKLFINLDLRNQSKFSLKSNLEKLIKVQTKENEVGLSYGFKKPIEPNTSINERWIPWNRNILKEIGYLIDNCKHVTAKTVSDEGIEEGIYDPFSSNQLQKMKMWITTSYSNISVTLSFLNQLSNLDSLESILNEVQKKFKPHQEYIKSIGGNIKYKEKEYLYNGKSFRLLITQLELPFV